MVSVVWLLAADLYLWWMDISTSDVFKIGKNAFEKHVYSSGAQFPIMSYMCRFIRISLFILPRQCRKFFARNELNWTHGRMVMSVHNFHYCLEQFILILGLFNDAVSVWIGYTRLFAKFVLKTRNAWLTMAVFVAAILNSMLFLHSFLAQVEFLHGYKSQTVSRCEVCDFHRYGNSYGNLLVYDIV
jgi:hypothetical protein